MTHWKHFSLIGGFVLCASVDPTLTLGLQPCVSLYYIQHLFYAFLLHGLWAVSSQVFGSLLFHFFREYPWVVHFESFSVKRKQKQTLNYAFKFGELRYRIFSLK